MMKNCLNCLDSDFAYEISNSTQVSAENENAISNLANINSFDFKVGYVTSTIRNLIKYHGKFCRRKGSVPGY